MPGMSAVQRRLVGTITSLDAYQRELHGTLGRDEILTLTLEHLSTVFTMEVSGFYFPDEKGMAFALGTHLPESYADRLNQAVDLAIEEGVFGWALNHSRPTKMRLDGLGTLVLAAMRTRARVSGMFAGLLLPDTTHGWDVSPLVLATYLACAADALQTDELTRQLQAHNRTLDELVRQRTSQLEAAKEEAEAASQAKSAFLTSVSHELRTPLNSILGYTQIMAASADLPERHREHLGVMQSSAEHLLDLINDLLDLSKVQAGKLELYPSTIPLPAFIEGLERVVLPRLRGKTIRFCSEILPGVPAQIEADAKRLRQVLLNLLDNAVKFTDRGEVRVRIHCQGEALCFAVEDTGCGIPEQDMGRLFRPFEQCGNSRGRAQGSGLGLAISHRLVHAMGGTLRVTSVPGSGSRFWFEIRIQASNGGGVPAVTASAPPRSTSILPDVEAPPHDKVRVLLELAARGDAMALKSSLDALERESGRPTGFISTLRALLASYRMKAVREFLQDQLPRVKAPQAGPVPSHEDAAVDVRPPVSMP